MALALSSLLLAAVRELDQTAFNEIEESPLPAFLKLDPPNCAACHLFSPFWASWAEAADNMGLEGRVWRVDCGVHQAVCKDRQVAHNGDESNFASAPDASFVGFFWNQTHCSPRVYCVCTCCGREIKQGVGTYCHAKL